MVGVAVKELVYQGKLAAVEVCGAPSAQCLWDPIDWRCGPYQWQVAGKVDKISKAESGAALFEQLLAAAMLTGKVPDKDNYFGNDEWDMAGMESDRKEYEADAAKAAAVVD